MIIVKTGSAGDVLDCLILDVQFKLYGRVTLLLSLKHTLKI